MTFENNNDHEGEKPVEPSASPNIPCEPDYEQAACHLALLDPGHAHFQFVAIKEGVGETGRFFGALTDAWPHVLAWQAERASVYVTANETDGKGRTLPHVTRLRTVWRDLDEPNPPAMDIPASFRVETSPGRFQDWLFVEGGLTPEQHASIMGRMVADYGADKAVVDIPRILRLAGTFNFKSRLAEPWLARIVSDDGSRYDAETLCGVFPAVPSAPRVARQFEASSDVCDGEQARIIDAVNWVPPDTDRPEWVAVGMALYHRFQGAAEGLQIWDDWSAKGAKYNADEIDNLWSGFRFDGVGEPQTIGTLYALAKGYGWKGEPWQVQEARERAAATAGDGMDCAGAMPDPRPTPAAVLPFETRFERLGVPLDQLKALPKTLWIVPGLLERGETTVVTAPGGVGKSQATLMVATAVAMGDGRLFGLDVRSQGPVLVLNAEDSLNDQRRRIGALDITHGISSADLPIFSYGGDAEGRHFVAMEKVKGELRETADYEALLSELVPVVRTDFPLL